MKTNKYVLKEENIIKQINSNDFIGIKIIDGEPFVYVPQSFRINKDIRIRNKEILLFLNTISIALNNKEYIRTSKHDLIDNMWPIESYLWILRDYFENGIYYNREKNYSKSSNGKIDWKKTLKTLPSISNKNIIYTDLICSKISPTNGKISEIHKYCIIISSCRIGWAFNLNVKMNYQKTMSKNEMEKIVLHELNSSFDDIKRMRFKHMLAILKNTSEDENISKDQTYGINNYYYVFEKMINMIFDGLNEKKMSEYYPHGQWHLYSDENISYLSSELRPDTIHHHIKSNLEKFTYVIDAKMYRYGNLKSRQSPIDGLPESSSIQKQITYAEYINYFVDTEYKVRNAFILPFDYTNEQLPEVEYLNDSKTFAYVGYANGDWRLSRKDIHGHILIEDYDYIFTFLIDYTYLLHNYKSSQRDHLELMINTIELKLKKLGRND